MAIIVSDSFNRADDPTGLGTADTGQVWSQVLGPVGALSINSNNALWTWHYPNARAWGVLETGFTDAITKVTLAGTQNVPQNYAVGYGLICRYVSNSYFWHLIYENFPSANQLRLQRTYAGSTTTVKDISGLTLTTNDTIAVAYCGDIFEVLVNDVVVGTHNASGSPQNYGTQSGLFTYSGTYFTTITKRWDDFLVETNGTCTPTYNCSVGACVDPGDGTGTYATLAACLAGCVVSESFNCTNGQCVDPGDGTGTYASLAACVASGCGGGSVVVETERFDAGTGSGYYYVAPIVDSEDELRSKTVKAVRVTGKLTNAAMEIYGYDVSDPIVTTDLEQGLNSTTGPIAITTANVAQTPREQVNVPNAVLHTVRILGDDTGETERDRIDEIVTEQSEIGVRR